MFSISDVRLPRGLFAALGSCDVPSFDKVLILEAGTRLLSTPSSLREVSLAADGLLTSVMSRNLAVGKRKSDQLVGIGYDYIECPGIAVHPKSTQITIYSYQAFSS